MNRILILHRIMVVFMAKIALQGDILGLFLPVQNRICGAGLERIILVIDLMLDLSLLMEEDSSLTRETKIIFDYRDRSASANSSTSSRKFSVSRASENSIEKKIDKILERLANLESKASFSNDVGFAEAEEVDTDNVFHVTDEVKTSMIADGGCPSTLSGKDVLDRYLSENDIQYRDLPTRNVNMIFKFGETKLTSNQVVEVPIKVKVVDEHGNVGVHYTEVSTYRVNGKVPYLLGLNTMEAWKAKLDMGDKKGLEISLDNGTRFLKILTPKDKTHMKIGLQPLKEKSLKQSVMYLQKEVNHKTEELVHHVQLDDLVISSGRDNQS